MGRPQAPTNFAGLNKDGTVSASLFPVLVQTVRAIELAYDSKIYLGGDPDFYSHDGTPLDGVVRLLADGSYDSSWTPELDVSATVYSIREQSDGRLVIAGSFASVNGIQRRCIARLRPDGNVDPSFTPPSLLNLRDFVLLPEGGVFSGGDGLDAMERLHDDGTASGFASFIYAQGDPFFNSYGVNALAIQPAGRLEISASGEVTWYRSASVTVCAFRADGVWAG